MKIKVVAGTPLHCHRENNSTNSQEKVLGTILALAFSPFGDLFIAETATRRVNFIRLVDTAGRVTHFAGKTQEKLKNNCGCNMSLTTASPISSQELPTACICGAADVTTSNAETLLSSNARFQAISALTVSPGGVLHVADQGKTNYLCLASKISIYVLILVMGYFTNRMFECSKSNTPS